MSFFTLIAVFALCGTVLCVAMMFLVNMPHSPLRDLLVQIVGWIFAVFCLLYCISPVDLLPEAFLGPFGVPDDIGAAVAGLMSAVAAWRAGKSRKQ